MNSLRRQLFTRLLISLLLVLAGAAAFFYWYLHHVLVSSFDVDLLDKAQIFAHSTEINFDRSYELEFLESNLPEFTLKHGTAYFQVWKLNGATEIRSPSLGNQDLPAPSATDKTTWIRSIDLPNNEPGRIAYVRFVPRPGEEGTPIPPEERPILVVGLAASSARLEESLEGVWTGLLLNAFALVLMVTPVVWWSLRRGLRSLDLIGEQAGAIDTNTLPQGFTSQGLPQELLPIAERLNDLLRRLHVSFTRERRFTSDAAHELRTPIAELRTLAEVGIAESATTNPALDGYFQDILAIAQHLERLVTTLLALARCESGLQGVHIQSFDASHLIDTTLRFFSQRRRDDIRISVNLPEQAQIQSDPDLIKMMFINIYSNAVTYASAGGHVDVTIARRGDSWVIRVSNTTSGLNADDLADIFKPFWRKKQNQDSESHYGLGLSLVAAYSSLLGLTVHAEIPEPNLFRIEIACPDSPQLASANAPDHFAEVP